MIFGKYRGLILGFLFISAIIYLGYRNDKKFDQFLSKIDPIEKKTESQKQATANSEHKNGEENKATSLESASPLTPSQVEEIVKSYIIQNPQIISEALDKLQSMKMEEMKKEVQLSISNHKSELEGATTSPILGNKEGKSIIVMFFDYNCGYCKQSAESIEKAISSDKDTKVILKVYPILGSDSEFLARIALAVNIHSPNKFHAIHSEFLSNKVFEKEDIIELLKDHKINYPEIEKLSESEEVTNLITNNLKLAQDLKINGVPAFIINGNYYPGFLSAEQLIEKSKAADTEHNNNEHNNTEQQQDDKKAK